MSGKQYEQEKTETVTDVRTNKWLPPAVRSGAAGGGEKKK